MKTIVIALGGNAINRPEQKGTTEEQFDNVDRTARQVALIARRGLRVVVTHGNGPQAGALLIQQEEAGAVVPPQSLAACGAMTQGQIGWMIQNRLNHHLTREGLGTRAVSIVTQVIVSAEDPDFADPSKPVGPFYSEEEAEELQARRGWTMKNVKPCVERCWRRVVPSPEPLEIVEQDVVNTLLREGVIVVASGGGGIPVVRGPDGSLSGVNAVIDKDKAAFALAQAVRADMLMILTDVERVELHYGTPQAHALEVVTATQAERYLREGHFLKGSMGPKVEACLRFVRWSGKPAVIGSLARAADALEGGAGTRFVA
jgi:carbamate kinase